ncbi:AI-2E family transporter [Okibacterium endophyticum]
MARSSEKQSWWKRLFAPEGAAHTRPPEQERPVTEDEIVNTVPRSVRVAAAWSWRLLLIAGMLSVLVFIVIQLRYIVIPLLIAVLVSSLLVPLVTFLVRHRWPRGLAVALAMVGTLAIVTGLLWVAIRQITADFAEVRDRTIVSFDSFKDWLLVSPLEVTEAELNAFFGNVMNAVQQDSGALVSGALSVGSTVGHVVAGLFLALFSLLFILIDGRGIWRWIVRLFPRRARLAVDGAGQAGWSTLANYARTQILVATIDAIGIGAGALLLGVPLALPIAVLVFLGAFVPIVGAVVTGAVAVFVALVYNGWVVALLMLGVVLLVQQIEGHVLQPLLMGTAVKVHPLAIVLVVAAGTMLAGIPGALFAVPIAAVLNVMIRYMVSGVWRTAPPGAPVMMTNVLWQTVPTQRTRRNTPSPANKVNDNKVNTDD